MYVLFFILNEVCVCTYVYIFYEIRLCHAEERCDLSNLAHIYLFYSFTDVEFTRGHSEMLLLPVPFELFKSAKSFTAHQEEVSHPFYYKGEEKCRERN